jgi:hypothetical protein
MVIGGGKIEQINEEPLLLEYFNIFKELFKQDELRLFVIGYGFGDEHINSVISDSVINHGLEIYILSPESPKKLKGKLCEGCKSIETVNIWNGISGYFQCVEKVFFSTRYEVPVMQEQFFTLLFGNNYRRF